MPCRFIIGRSIVSSRFFSHVSRTSICSRCESSFGIAGIGSFDLFWREKLPDEEQNDGDNIVLI